MGFGKGRSVAKPRADDAFSEWILRLYPVSSLIVNSGIQKEESTA